MCAEPQLERDPRRAARLDALEAAQRQLDEIVPALARGVEPIERGDRALVLAVEVERPRARCRWRASASASSSSSSAACL